MAYKKLKYWFDRELAELLGNKISSIYEDFDTTHFVEAVEQQLGDLELKDRVELIADELHGHLGQDYKRGIDVLVQILGPENEEETGMFKTYYWVMPIAKYVEKYGLDEFELSMYAIEEITKRNTGEYTIRPFIEQDVNRTLTVMKKWSESSNKHVRRLSSEGLRPRLPWASKLDCFIENPEPVFPILNNLKDDPSKYVQKSVANCINDILKDNVEVGKRLVENWNQDLVGKERKWIIKHALRSLLKADDEWARQMITHN